MIRRNFLLRWAVVLGSLSAATTSGAAATVNDGSIVNNASYTLASPNVAPGTMVAIFGTNLTDGTSCVHAAGCDPSFDSSGRLMTTMSGAQVTVNDIPVPIFYATPQQLGIQIPTELTGTSATVVVTVAGQSSTPRTIAIDPFSPGIFTFSQDGKGAGTITHMDTAGTLVDAQHPAAPGETLIIYATGLGQVTPAVPTGALPNGTVTTVAPPTVTIDGLPAQVQFSGLSGCCVGLNQINVVVPSNVHIGNHISVVLSIGGKQSNTVTITTAAQLNLSDSATPSSINIENVPVGTSDTVTMTLTNTGSASVTISQATVTGTVFSLSGLTFPLTLGIGQSISFLLSFTPTAAGTATGILSITSDPTSSPTTVSLAGNGVHFVDLTWTASTTPTVVSYNIYRSTTSGVSFTTVGTGPYAKLNSTPIPASVCTPLCTYTDSNAVAGQTYFYRATAVDASSAESNYSVIPSPGEAQAVVPVP